MDNYSISCIFAQLPIYHSLLFHAFLQNCLSTIVCYFMHFCRIAYLPQSVISCIFAELLIYHSLISCIFAQLPIYHSLLLFFDAFVWQPYIFLCIGWEGGKVCLMCDRFYDVLPLDSLCLEMVETTGCY